MLIEDIREIVVSAVKSGQKRKELPEFVVPDISINVSGIEEHGDYSTNLPLILSKELNKNPLEIAEIIVELLKDNEIFEDVKIAKPGFINFFLSTNCLLKELKQALEENYGKIDLGKGKKVQIEFISANPTGPLTVGNARGGPFGDCLANILEKAGYFVERAYYVNNCGNQILSLGHSVLKDEEAEYKGEYIDELSRKIKEKDPYLAGEKAAEYVIDSIRETVGKLGIEYDEWFFEKELHQSKKIDEVIDFLKEKKLVYEKEGALWFTSTNFGDLRDRVLIKSDGQKTYLAGDIAYHRYKFEEKKFDKVINVWGADHHGDVPGLQAGTEALGHKGKLDIILLQFVTLYQGKEKAKMSKRGGNYVTMDDLLDMVGKDAVRFFFLQKSADTHLNFDISLAKEKSEKNPVFYIQYAHARICSILQKIKDFEEPNLKLLSHPKEMKLIKKIIQFPRIIDEISKNYQTQKLPEYAIDLASAFHGFYQECRVLGEEELNKARISLILIVKRLLKDTLDLMGVDAPEKM